MRLKVDTKNDALYLRLDESAVVESEEVRPGIMGIILDYNAEDQVVGIEILGIRKRIPEQMLKRLEFETL